jgi:hypothetical protein
MPLLSIQTPLGNGLRRRKTIPSCNRMYDWIFKNPIITPYTDLETFCSMSPEENQSESLPRLPVRSLKLTGKNIFPLQCDRKQPCSACLERDDESNCKLSEKDIAPKLTYVRQNPFALTINPNNQLIIRYPCAPPLRCGS